MENKGTPIPGWAILIMIMVLYLLILCSGMSFKLTGISSKIDILTPK